MPDKPTLEEFRDLGLLPHQASFAMDFLKSDSPPHHILAAPAGSGKTYLGAALISQLLVRGTAKRILVLIPTPLRHVYHHSLLKQVTMARVEEIDRQRFRELEASVPVGETPWPESIVALLSIDTAKQKDIAKSLATVRWDLVLVDEAHLLSGTQREALIKHLLEKDAISRLLLFTRPYTEPIGGESLSLTTLPLLRTEWGLNVSDWNGQFLFPQIQSRRQFISYTRAPDEIQFLETLRICLEGLSWTREDNSVKGFVTKIIYRRASSSIFALEQTLLGFRRKLLQEASIKKWNANVEQDETEELVVDNSAPLLTDTSEVLQRLPLLIQALDEVSNDEKQKTLVTLLNNIWFPAKEQKHWVAIFSAFRDTASYLHTTLSEFDRQAFLITGGMSFEERINAIGQFQMHGGILLTTWAGLEGTILPYVDNAIFYDLPDSAHLMEQIRGRIDRIGRTKACDWYFFRDSSKAISVEDELLARLGLIDAGEKK